jgi:hypothetical protein
VKPTERVIARGILAGIVGATLLAAWFLVVDTLRGQPFHTPAFMARILAHVEGVDRSTGLVLMYTAFHYAAFALVGVGMAALVRGLGHLPTLLLGLVLGFLLFDLVFYAGVLLTGVNVVEELGWPHVLAGNLLAGFGLVATLHVEWGRTPVAWWRAFTEHRILREGVAAGLLGAAAVAAWFFLFDLVRREPLFTPGALGSAVFLGVRDLADVRITFATVAGYTVLHVAAFVVTGIVAAAIVFQAERTPPILLAALLLFAAFEALFVGALVILAEWLLGALAWWTVALGNLVATAAMATYLWRSHPRLREAVHHPFD